MNRAAVIGDPIAHSLSPAIFSFLAQELQSVDLGYEAVQVKPGELAQFVSGAKQKCIGFNVTLPHKEKVIALIEDISPEAKAIGAVNCVVAKNKGAGFKGFNTDVVGFTESLLEAVPTSQRHCALVLGAGGSARAVTYALATLKYEKIYVLNKTLEKAERLSQTMQGIFGGAKIEALTSVNDLREAPDLAVNATSLGMQGTVNSSALSAGEYFESIFNCLGSMGARGGAASAKAVAFDLIYKPSVTPFMVAGQNHGVKVVNGLDMLAYQALASWQLWFGPIADLKKVKNKLTIFLRSKLLEQDRPRQIFLTGFMGAGKSTVGKLLAKQLGWSFIDTDSAIEKKHKMKVSELFEKLGEDKFRKIESELLAEICEEGGRVVALGGGTLIRHENLEKIEAAGLLIYLSASSDKLHSRLKHFSESRPLLKHGENVTLHEHIDSLLQVRVAQYEKAAVEIVTDDVEPQEVAAAILRKLSAPK